MFTVDIFLRYRCGNKQPPLAVQYMKSRLNPVYLHENNKMKILTVMKPLREQLGW